DFFAGGSALRADIRALLAGAPDLARALARLSLARGGPRDLAAIRDSLHAASALASKFERADNLPPELVAAVKILKASDSNLQAELARALDEQLPLFTRDGGFVRAGYNR